MVADTYAVQMPTDTDLLISQLKTLDSGSFRDESKKLALIEELKRAVNNLSRPSDLAFNHIFGNAAYVAAISILIEAGVFTKWEEDGTDPLSCTRLSELTGVDVVLLSMLIMYTYTRIRVSQCH